MWKVRMILAGLALFVALGAAVSARAVCPHNCLATVAGTTPAVARCPGVSNCLAASGPTGGRPGSNDICPNGGCGSSTS